jgi:GTP-binding protein Era
MAEHRAGFVNIIGNPNVGKSTLMNALVGEKVSIITSKAQTTRHRIMGIVNAADFQIVYSDTPGVLKPGYKLHEKMMAFVNTALIDADVILFVTDITDPNPIDADLLARVKTAGVPVLLLINKIDLSEQKIIEQKVQEWALLLPKAEIILVSALEKFNLSYVFDKIISLIPVCPPYYDKEELTDKTQRFFVSEIIREKVLLIYEKEIPYSVEVVIESFKEEERIIKISALILVERDSQKGILIGHLGKNLKRLGTDARIDMEEFLGKKVFLELFVKVDKDWRNNEGKLKHFGYN